MLATLALTVLALPAAGADDDVVLRWRGRDHSPDQPPPELPAPVREAVSVWAPWCVGAGYRLDVDDPGRVLMITPAGNRARGRQLRLIERTVELFERQFPPPEGRAGAATPASAPADEPGSKPGALPEDPEGEGEHPWDVRGKRGVEPAPTPTRWGAETTVLDRETIVFVIPRDQRAYGSVLAHVAGRHPELAGWAASARGDQGFVLPWPLVGAYLERPDGVEEWSPNNELVHRVGRLLLARRFGALPYWVDVGTGWHFEVSLLDGVYVFPYRDEFVWAVEHAAWRDDLKRSFADRARAPLRASEFCELERGTYEGTPARVAFGFVHFLATTRHPGLPPLLDALRVQREAGARVETGPGTWKRDRRYRIPVSDQERTLREHLGADVLAEAAAFFRAGLESGKRR